jgi:hypothetical protein
VIAARTAIVALLLTIASVAHAATRAPAPPDSIWLLRTTNAMVDAITIGDSTAWAPYLARDWFITDEEGGEKCRQRCSSATSANTS